MEGNPTNNVSLGATVHWTAAARASESKRDADYLKIHGFPHWLDP